MSRRLVGIAGVGTAGPGGVLAALGLGSCVAVAIRGRDGRRGALAHIMLPRRSEGRPREGENLSKYADAAVAAAVSALESAGCRRREMEAKIAGGASIFDLGRGTELGDIGARNVEAVVDALAAAGVRLVATDVGGREGRSVEYSVDTGELRVRTARGLRRRL